MRSTSKADSRVLPRRHAVQTDGGDAAPQQHLDEEGRRARLEPVRPELPLPEQQQDVERIVDPFRPPPAVAVVPMPDRIPVEALELGREHRVEIAVRIAADGGVGRTEGDVPQIVQPGEQPGLRELAHPGQETEPDVRVAGLDAAVEAPQEIPVRTCNLRFLKRVQDRLPVPSVTHGQPRWQPYGEVQGSVRGRKSAVNRFK